MEWIDILKKAATMAYDKTHHLLGTKEGAEIVQQGAGGDSATKIDIVAENTVIEELVKKNLDFHLVSEEIGDKYYGDEMHKEKCTDYIILDPIDGSLNANRGIPYSCISVARATGPNTKYLTEGVVMNVYNKDMFWAVIGKGAFLNNKSISVSKIEDIDKAVMGVSISAKEPVSVTFNRYKPLIDKVYKVRVMGAVALMLCEVANGSFDFHLDIREKVRIVDLAAGMLIVQEAGGVIFTRDGNPIEVALSINSTSSIIASSKKFEKYVKEDLPKLNHYD